MPRRLTAEERRERLFKEKPKQITPKRQLAFHMAFRDLHKMIDILKEVHPILAQEMDTVLWEMFKAVPQSQNASSVAWDEYPGVEERRRQRYEERKAFLEGRFDNDISKPYEARLNWLLKELEEEYNSPLLAPAKPAQPAKWEPPKPATNTPAQPRRDKAKEFALLLAMLELLKISEEPAQDEQPEEQPPYVDPDVWNFDGIDFDGES